MISAKVTEMEESGLIYHSGQAVGGTHRAAGKIKGAGGSWMPFGATWQLIGSRKKAWGKQTFMRKRAELVRIWETSKHTDAGADTQD